MGLFILRGVDKITKEAKPLTLRQGVLLVGIFSTGGTLGKRLFGFENSQKNHREYVDRSFPDLYGQAGVAVSACTAMAIGINKIPGMKIAELVFRLNVPPVPLSFYKAISLFSELHFNSKQVQKIHTSYDQYADPIKARSEAYRSELFSRMYANNLSCPKKALAHQTEIRVGLKSFRYSTPTPRKLVDNQSFIRKIPHLKALIERVETYMHQRDCDFERKMQQDNIERIGSNQWQWILLEIRYSPDVDGTQLPFDALKTKLLEKADATPNSLFNDSVEKLRQAKSLEELRK